MTYGLAINLFSGLLALWLILLFFLFLWKLFSLLLNRYNNYKLSQCVDKIDKFIFQGGEPDVFPKNKAVRSYLVKLSKIIKGDEFENVKKLYIDIGFHKKDLKDLLVGSYRKKIYALSRVMQMGQLVPVTIHRKLLHAKEDNIRWNAMEYYIQVYQKESLEELFIFLGEQRNISKKGVALYLLSIYGEYDPDGLYFMLPRVHGNLRKELLLKTLELFPKPGSDEIVLNVINDRSTKNMIISSMKILSHYSNDHFVTFLEIYKDHPSWVLRMFVARYLSKIFSDKSFKILMDMSNQSEYQIKSEVAKSMMMLNTQLSNHYVKDVISNVDHPMYKYMKNQYSLSLFSEGV